MKFSVISLVVVFLLNQINSLYFHLYKGERKCFYDEFYSDLVVMIRYKVLDKGINLTNQNDKRIEISLYNSEDKKVAIKHQAAKLEGKFSYSIEKTGHYKICVMSNDRDLFQADKRIKFSLIVDTDEDELDEEEISVKNKDFEEVDKKVKKLANKANQITKIQEFQITTEDEFSQTQFNSSNRIIMSTIISIVIITVIGFWQIYSLRKVFKEKVFF